MQQFVLYIATHVGKAARFNSVAMQSVPKEVIGQSMNYQAQAGGLAEPSVRIKWREQEPYDILRS